MKKVMIGILILIPVLILVIVAAVSNLLSHAAWIAVDDFTLTHKSTGAQVESVSLEFNDAGVFNFNDFIDVKVMPERANRYSLEWQIAGAVECMDEKYEEMYKSYLEDKDNPNATVIKPPAMFVDEDEREVESNTTGKISINSFCRFSVVVRAENVIKTFSVTVEGYDVKSVKIVNLPNQDSNRISIGESKRVDVQYTPLGSIVSKTEWFSSDSSVATVDGNGVITGRGVGTADITVQAYKYGSDTEFVTSETYAVEVAGAVASSKFGGKLTTSKSSFTLEEIGVRDAVTNYEGCSIDKGIVNMSSSFASITTSSGTLEITLCDEDDIGIANASQYAAINGFVFAVSELPLKLSAVWTDCLKTGNPENVEWTSSDGRVATVSGGVVNAVSSGLVEITAKSGEASAKVILNVQVKVVSMQLRTSDSSLAVGLARETVFAAEKYTDLVDGGHKEPNSVLIHVVGEPVRQDNEGADEFSRRLALFYSAYDFEITEGAKYAEIGDKANMIVFKPAAIESDGRQSITVKVSAKYPKYDSITRYTTESVTLNVVYGVEVNNIAELRQASLDQKDYAYSEDNYIEAECIFEHFNTANGRNDRYRSFNAPRSKKLYSISFGSDIGFEVDENGEGIRINGDQGIFLYGNVYGNNKRLYGTSRKEWSSETKRYETVSQFDKWAPMFRLTHSDILISNINIRANDVAQDGTISGDETKGFMGQCIYANYPDDDSKYHITGLRVEYCILENAKRALEMINADIEVDGTIMRNHSNTATFMPTCMRTRFDEDGIRTTYATYSHVNLNNCIYSNCLMTVASIGYQRYTIMPKKNKDGNDEYDDYDDNFSTKGLVGRFVRDDMRANEEYFMNNFYNAKDVHGNDIKINSGITQTGFLDIYNWQDTANANLVDVENEAANALIGNVAGSVIGKNSAFKDVRYRDEENNKWYFPMGIISTGISFDHGINLEPVYPDIKFSDKRFAAPINTIDVKKENKGLIGIYEGSIKTFNIRFFTYRSDADITPFSTYEINTRLIAHLHGEV